MKRIGLILASILMSASAFSFDHSYKSWDDMLQASVKMYEFKSEVNYDYFVKNKDELKKYNATLSAVTKAEFDKWSKDQQLTFLINVYNSFTIQLIADHYPVNSIKDRKISWLSPFNKEFFVLFGKKRSLSEVEHKMIRKWFEEYRIHFAIVCASIGCPALQNKAFTPENMEELLAKGQDIFLGDNTRNRYDEKTNEIQVSKIFKWFKEDFEKKHGNIKNYFWSVWKMDESKKAKFMKADVEHLDYDWNLNKTN